MDNSQAYDLATEILDNIVAKHLTFTLKCTEYTEDGSVYSEYTQRAQNIHDGIVKLLEEHG